MIDFLSIVIFLIIVILVVFRVKLNFFKWRINLVLVGIYLAVLIMAVPIMYLLPMQDITTPVKDTNQVVEETDQEKMIPLGDIFKNYNGQSLGSPGGVYQNSSKTFKFAGNTLALNIPSNDNYNILVDRKNVDDGEIEVSSFIAPHNINGVDFTKEIEPPDISVQGNTLSIIKKKQQLNFAQFEANFVLDQFTHLNVHDNRSNVSSFGENVVLLRVPKSLEIEKGNYNGGIISNVNSNE